MLRLDSQCALSFQPIPTSKLRVLGATALAVDGKHTGSYYYRYDMKFGIPGWAVFEACWAQSTSSPEVR